MEEDGPREKLFRFEQLWAEHEGCEGVVDGVWMIGGPSLEGKLAACAAELKGWSDAEFGQIFKEIRKKRKRLKTLNKGGRSDEQVRERKRLVREISDLLHQEEVYWRHRSRATWLFSGDRNSSFFHRKASQRRKKNSIASLVSDDGVRQVGDEKVGRVANEYFQKLFLSSCPSNFGAALGGSKAELQKA